MLVSWSVRHHFEVQPAGHPANGKGDSELAIAHAQPLTMSKPFWVMAHTMP